jgi:hypothetical protein
MLLVTFHGGKNLVNNVYAYNDSGGDPLEKAVLKGADNYLKDGEARLSICFRTSIRCEWTEGSECHPAF